MTGSRRPTLAVAMPPTRMADVIDPATRELIDQRFTPIWADEDFAADLPALVGGADVVLTSWGTPRLDRDLLLTGARPTVVAHAAGTVKNLVPLEAVEAGVPVFSAAGRIAWSVGEYCLASILTLLRRLPDYDRRLRAGEWKPTAIRGAELRGRRVALIGASSTARALITLLQPFGPEIVVYDPYLDPDRAASLGVRSVPLAEAMRSDVVSVHVPNVPATEHLITAELIDQVPDGAVVINSARAAAVDQAHLIAQARAGRLLVGLDVFVSEPPTLGPEVTDCPNVLITPHIAGDSVQGHQALAGYVLNDVLAWLDHGTRGPSFVDPAVWSIAA